MADDALPPGDFDALAVEIGRLRRFAREARALAFSGDCDYCGATDRLLDLVDKYGITKDSPDNAAKVDP